MVMLAAGETPSHIQDRLNGFLRPEQHDYFDVIAAATETSAAVAGNTVSRPGGANTRPRTPKLLGLVGT
jgi:hypothetical protein